ncbi:STAS domain-containing protein [Chloroflexus sp.]|uniref:STAS domain-containing protein n=1 Tax=Chloroflexus sp. TaxID=1904827 RepID=UPI00261A2DC8|nr:STAS domain-containing protein [uncultured Chloroflexus sp.]
MSDSSTPTLSLAQVRQLQLFFAFVAGIVGVVAVVATISTIIWQTSTLIALMVLDWMLVVGFLLAWSQVRAGQVRVGLATSFIALIGYGLIGALILPTVTALMAFAPVIAIVTMMPFLGGVILKRLLIIAWIGVVVTMIVGTQIRLFPPIPVALEIPFQFTGVLGISAILLLQLWLFHERLMGVITQLRKVNADLEQERASLQERIAARTQELQQALHEIERQMTEQSRLLAENERQRELIRGLSMPVLPVGQATLVMPLVGELDDSRIQLAQSTALQAIDQTGARYLVLDITGLPFVDTTVAAGLIRLAQAARLLGAEVILAGARPEVAQTIVALGIDLAGVTTAADLASALRRSQMVS